MGRPRVPTDVPLVGATLEALLLGHAIVQYVAQRRGAPIPHPWPVPLPVGWSGQLGERKPLDYVPVQPTVVLVDAALDEEAGRLRHRAAFVRVRADLSPYDASRASGF
ncbi:hypothetical protein KZZ52_33910 [Dactylosporangium sp. AC04546]|uniref:hypothetical protein n=1 Tax=Dactylosporangium sp. AC04546 TaxID=2862460 RepID=UPI001EDE4BB0|nr:hypothetical protein [Dactylosporangium sp. AC04546]WVK78969.1 hypothetical protein KZZ52_33910 [Dactylosporangium sp. AC04546]